MCALPCSHVDGGTHPRRPGARSNALHPPPHRRAPAERTLALPRGTAGGRTEVGAVWSGDRPVGRPASEPRHRCRRSTALLSPLSSFTALPATINHGYGRLSCRFGLWRAVDAARVVVVAGRVRSCRCRPCGPGRGGDPNLVPPARGVPALRSPRIFPDRKAIATHLRACPHRAP